ncbi:MAG: deoxyhypusine synthase [Candidatus Thorarchaeota archaeon]|nr:MAG: deoxyhypusine synthase [Candidatus Thorarchaeota archaeon]
MERVKYIDPQRNMSVAELVHAMQDVGVLGAGRLGRATAIVSRMFEDPECFTFLSMSGPMVPGGLRNMIAYLVREGYIDAIVTSGANIVHDLVEAYGGAHYRVPQERDDIELRQMGMGRIADIIVRNEDFELFEKMMYRFLDSLSQKKRVTLAPSEFLTELGDTLTDKTSILRQAALKKVPIFSPGLMDSMLGFHMYTYSTMQPLSLDFVKDLRILGEMITATKRTGAIMLGGGLAKHFAMGSTILRGGLDMAIQITLDRPEGGSLSGAPIAEGISWQKVQTDANYETVIGDATVIFPLMVIAAISSEMTHR